jgi:hypothetical protein
VLSTCLNFHYLVASDHNVLATLQAFATNKKSGYERESAAIAFQSLATTFGPSIGPILLPYLSVIMDLYMDKGEVVRIAATAAVKSTLKLFPPESTRVIFRSLENILANGKWRTKIGALDGLKSFVAHAKDAVAAELGNVLPKVEAAMHDTKQEVRSFLILSKGWVHHPFVIRCRVRLSSVPHHYARLLRTPISFLTFLHLSNACQIPMPSLRVLNLSPPLRLWQR